MILQNIGASLVAKDSVHTSSTTGDINQNARNKTRKWTQYIF